MTRTARIALAVALCTAALSAGGAARADDAMKPADATQGGAMKSDDGGAMMMKSDDAMMKADKAMADCKAKAGMETDQMKKDAAMKACDGMAMKPAQ